MKIKQWIMVVLLVGAVLSLVACSQSSGGDGNESASNGTVYSLKVGTALTASDPIYQGLEAFKERVEERTDNHVRIEIFGSGSLGEDNDIIEQAKIGSNVAVIVDSARLAEMVPEIGILTAPYIVDSFEEANTVVQSDLFGGWVDQLAESHNLQVLSFNWYQGERHLLTKKEIQSPEDLRGVQLRTPGSPIWLESIRAMGASPTGMPWSEVYPAIQQGVIDGAEAQHPATYGAKLHEVVTHISKTRHFQLVTGIVAGANWMNQLPEEYQEIIYEEAAKAGEEASLQTVEKLEEFEQSMLDESNVEIHDVDIDLFKAATEVVYEKFDGFMELREEINNILGK
ncbi:C4-dicarboxylate TRAP transporter substrate-binding protein [Bacillus horti]|uniref:Tripartite ATP-independent transporter DctP family solute receptor n=1 Tax=Caldalkalibacillus horti TaxID=77523 RepID=A0ABT9VZE0_9BACI|nr:C4-dicarboxylate TRAP transporter substrate-binding protein [Bacillus horti]MDQ0166187.1 tripartite ATP-independent transporter DctP family solute receptor [Bacillus horti]